jgi:hypothetical protein
MLPLCECGCGNEVTLAKRTNKSHGIIKGMPLRFFNNHGSSFAKTKETHCVHGHERNAENTSSGSRCRICSNAAKTKYVQHQKEQLVEYKGGICVDCKGAYPMCCYQFDHRDPMDKEFSISSKAGYPLEILKTEADKCDLVCANCHAIRTSTNPAVGKKISNARRSRV